MANTRGEGSNAQKKVLIDRTVQGRRKKCQLVVVHEPNVDSVNMNPIYCKVKYLLAQA